MLRERLTRFLSSGPQNPRVQQPVHTPRLADPELVELLQHLVYEPGRDAATARAVYEQAAEEQIAAEEAAAAEAASASTVSSDSPPQTEARLASNPDATAPVLAPLLTPPSALSALPGPEADAPRPSLPSVTSTVTVISTPADFSSLSPPPTFDQLNERGWIRTVLGRVWASDTLRIALLRDRSNSAPAYRALLQSTYVNRYRLESGYTAPSNVAAVAEEIARGQVEPTNLECLSRAWTAAKLVPAPSQTLNDSGEPQGPPTFETGQLLHWLDQWEVLQAPKFSLRETLELATVEALLSKALEVLTTADATPDWEEFGELAATPTALLYPHRAAGVIVRQLPQTTIDRVRWLNHDHLAFATFHELLAATPSTLLTLLLNELEESILDPRGFASRLMAICVERPMYLGHLVSRAEHSPSVLADMLMDSTVCALACRVVADWETRDSGWNREFEAPSNRANELQAFKATLIKPSFQIDLSLGRSLSAR